MRLTILVLLMAATSLFGNPEVRVDIPGGATMDFVWIEPGTFMMGKASSTSDVFLGDRPQHEVTISEGYWLGKYEVTQEQWAKVMETRPWSGQDYVVESPRHPAAHVTWNDVQEYVDRLNGRGAGGVFRLPTEAEWEYACRAGTTTRYAFGDDEGLLDQYAWYVENVFWVGLSSPQQVGTKLPNLWGLHDMHGNVWEFCLDWSGRYSGEDQVDPQGPSTGSRRVIRGGYAGSTFHGANSASRSDVRPTTAGYDLGARLVMDPSPTAVVQESWGELKAGGAAAVQLRGVPYQGLRY